MPIARGAASEHHTMPPIPCPACSMKSRSAAVDAGTGMQVPGGRPAGDRA